jgi:hypothetical protein
MSRWLYFFALIYSLIMIPHSYNQNPSLPIVSVNYATLSYLLAFFGVENYFQSLLIKDDKEEIIPISQSYFFAIIILSNNIVLPISFFLHSFPSILITFSLIFLFSCYLLTLFLQKEYNNTLKPNQSHIHLS